MTKYILIWEDLAAGDCGEDRWRPFGSDTEMDEAVNELLLNRPTDVKIQFAGEVSKEFKYEPIIKEVTGYKRV